MEVFDDFEEWLTAFVLVLGVRTGPKNGPISYADRSLSRQTRKT